MPMYSAVARPQKLTEKDVTSTPEKQTIILKCLQKAEWIFRITRLLLYYLKNSVITS